MMQHEFDDDERCLHCGVRRDMPSDGEACPLRCSLRPDIDARLKPANIETEFKAWELDETSDGAPVG